MNPSEAAKLLTVASGFDRRVVTEVTATAWALALNGHGYTECERAVIEHHRDPATRGAYLEVRHVLDRVERWQRASAGEVEADVRSAKARGFIEQSWPYRQPLPLEVAVRLSAARAQDGQTATRYLEIGTA